MNNFEEVNNNFDSEMKLAELKKELLKSFERYRQTLKYLAADAPISILCLPPAIEKILLRNDCLRVYDLIDLDFTKIKGFGETRVRDLTTRLDQFFAML